MSRFSKDHVPVYRLHKPSGKARVRIDGRDHYLGAHGTAESREAYNQLIARWFAAGRNATALAVMQEQAAADVVTVEQVLAAFLIHAQQHYRGRDGGQSLELVNFKHVMILLRRMFGKTDAGKFRAKSLKMCRDEMIRARLSRKTINRRVGRIRHIFSWAVSDELVPASVIVSLQAVTGLQAGRSDAREKAPVKAVSEQYVRQAIRHANRIVAAMLELQTMTGMRSGELVIMRTGDINRSDPRVWTYRPAWHKNQHRDQDRIVYLGKQAQEIIGPFLRLDPTAYLFSPAEAEFERKAALSAARKTPITCGNSIGTNRVAKPRRQPGPRYTPGSYAVAVAKACDKAFPPPARLDTAALKAWRKANRFHPHQLRHTAATRFRKENGIETARVLLGQKSLDSTQIYAEADQEKAVKAVGKAG